jgi:ABC-type transporter Mla subunit MlaD
MASVALPNIKPLPILPTDSYTVVTLKNAYNNLLENIQQLASVINTQGNNLAISLEQLNTNIDQLNDLAANINALQPTAQVSAQQAVSSLNITVTGQVNLV